MDGPEAKFTDTLMAMPEKICMHDYVDNKMVELNILFTNCDIADNSGSLVPSEKEKEKDSWKLTTRNHCLSCGGEGIEAFTK